MKLFELQTSLDWTWRTDFDDTTYAEFQVNDKLYRVTFDSFYLPGVVDQQNWWDVSFALVDEKGEEIKTLTGTGDARTVFAAVIAIVQEFIQKYNPEVLAFSAQEPERFRLYSRLLGILARQGWRVEERELGGDMIYKAFRPGYEG